MNTGNVGAQHAFAFLRYTKNVTGIATASACASRTAYPRARGISETIIQYAVDRPAVRAASSEARSARPGTSRARSCVLRPVPHRSGSRPGGSFRYMFHTHTLNALRAITSSDFSRRVYRSAGAPPRRREFDQCGPCGHCDTTHRHLVSTLVELRSAAGCLSRAAALATHVPGAVGLGDVMLQRISDHRVTSLPWPRQYRPSPPV